MSVADKDKVAYFQAGDFRLAFRDEGEGVPVLLIHGFASSSFVNWVATGWFATLRSAGYRVIAIDNRGHGFSSKSYDPAHYHPQMMAGDAVSLLRHLGLEGAHVMGYSMGARISAFMALHAPDYVLSAVFGGLGIGMVRGAGSWEPVAQALLAEDVTTIPDERGLMFRKFADRTGGDRRALAACIKTSKQELTKDDLLRIKQPVLVAVGTRDEIGGAAQPLADLLPKGEALPIPDRDHMLAVGDKIYKQAVLDFLNRFSCLQKDGKE